VRISVNSSVDIAPSSELFAHRQAKINGFGLVFRCNSVEQTTNTLLPDFFTLVLTRSPISHDLSMECLN